MPAKKKRILVNIEYVFDKNLQIWSIKLDLLVLPEQLLLRLRVHFAKRFQHFPNSKLEFHLIFFVLSLPVVARQLCDV